MKKFIPLLALVPTYFYIKRSKKKKAIKDYLARFGAKKIIKLSCGDLSTIELIFRDKHFIFRQSNYNPDDMRERYYREGTKILRICDCIDLSVYEIYLSTKKLVGHKYEDMSESLDWFNDEAEFTVEDIISDFKTLYDGEKYTIEIFE